MTVTDDDTYTPAGNVIEALARCISEVRAVGKDSRNNEQKYNFRGVDAVVNAVHPVLAKHRVVIVPHAARPTYTPVTSKHGTAGRFVDLELTYRVYGPGGPEDHIDVAVYGESADYGDKATAKAFSVGYRICLLQVLNLPTDDPDPDAGAAFEHVSQRTAQTQAVPDLPADLATAREAVRGAWAFMYGAFDQKEAAAAYNRWSGGVLTEATAGDLRKYAAYLSALPANGAGGDPVQSPPPANGERPPVAPPDDDPIDRKRKRMFALFKEVKLTERQAQLEWISSKTGRTVKSRGDLTEADFDLLISKLKEGDVPAVEPDDSPRMIGRGDLRALGGLFTQIGVEDPADRLHIASSLVGHTPLKGDQPAAEGLTAAEGKTLLAVLADCKTRDDVEALIQQVEAERAQGGEQA